MKQFACSIIVLVVSGLIAGCASQKSQRAEPVIDPDKVHAMEMALHKAPQDTQLREQLIRAYIQNKRYIEARCMLSRILDNDSGNITANYLMGLTYGRQELYEDAKVYYSNVLEQDPNHIPTLFNLAVINQKTNNFAQAKKQYEKILQQKPRDYDTHYNLALLYDKHFIDPKNALYHYRLYLEYAPVGPELELRRPLILDRIHELEMIESEKIL